jgi:hypothetical protein
MIRLSLLQFRFQAAIAAAGLTVFAVALAVTGPHLARLYDTSGLGSCHGSSCQNPAVYFSDQLAGSSYPVLYKIGTGVILVLPAVIGLFWGAPLIARELETGTCALAWNQSVSRNWWLAVKLTVGGLAALAVTEGLSLMLAWWAAPINRAVGEGVNVVGNRFAPLLYATSGIAPLGYAGFAFALGTAAGVMIRRTIPAMAVALAVFAAIQVAVPLWIRPNLLPRDHALVQFAAFPTGDFGDAVVGPGAYTFAIKVSDVPGQPGSWLLSSGPVNAAGRPDLLLPAVCAKSAILNGPPPPPPENRWVSCLDSQGMREAISYQPASRYWPFQWIETGFYLTLALTLTGYCFGRLRRRPS